LAPPAAETGADRPVKGKEIKGKENMNGAPNSNENAGKRGWLRKVASPVVFFLLGAAASAVWFSNGHLRPAVAVDATARVSAPSEAAAAQPGDSPKSLTRAIAKTANTKALAQPAAPADAATLDAVRRAIPNVEAVSLEDGTRILRTAALAQFTQAANEMQAEAREAQQQFLKAESNQSEAGQQAARAQLTKAQQESATRLKEISLEAHNQIAALQQLKTASP